jgi:fructokinase
MCKRPAASSAQPDLQRLGSGCHLGAVRIGIDVGGTKIEGLLLGDEGRELARLRVATPTDYAEVLAAIGELVHGLDARAAGGQATVGVGTPGFLQPGGGAIRNSNLLCLNEQRMDRDLEKGLGRPVRLANDAKCFVLSEAIDGAAATPANPDRGRPDVVFGATLGTGVGGGIAVDGRLLTGENGAATEWSHTTLPFLRPDETSPYVCVCGHPDCIESFVSGRGLAATYRRLGGEAVAGSEVGRRAAAGDPLADRAFAFYEECLARALAMVVNMIDPRAIVLGGGVSNNERIFRNLPAALEPFTVAKQLRTKIVQAAHGDASGVRGAALLW